MGSKSPLQTAALILNPFSLLHIGGKLVDDNVNAQRSEVEAETQRVQRDGEERIRQVGVREKTEDMRAAQEAARARQRALAANAAGRQSTLLTGTPGAPAPTSDALGGGQGKTLLGQ